MKKVIYMKIIVRKAEAPKGRGGDTKTDATVGAVICKASFLEDAVVAAKKKLGVGFQNPPTVAEAKAGSKPTGSS